MYCTFFFAFLKMYFYLTKYARKILFWNNLYFLCTFKIRSVWNSESDLVKLVTFFVRFSDFSVNGVVTQQKYRNFTHHNLKSLQHGQHPCPAHEMRLHTIMCKILVKFPHVTTLRIFLYGTGITKWSDCTNLIEVQYFSKKVLSRNLAFILDIAKRLHTNFKKVPMF